MERRKDVQEQLLQVTSEFGPLMSRIFEIIKEHAEEKPVAVEIWKELADVSDEYIKHDNSLMIRVAQWAKEHAHETRGMLALAQLTESTDHVGKQIGAQIGAWVNDYAALGEESQRTSTSSVDG